MSVLPEPPWPPGKQGLYTMDDYDQLSDDGPRYELLDGRLIVSPRPTPLHNLVGRRLCNLLEAELPEGYLANSDVDVGFRDRTQCLAPDILVTTRVRAESRASIPAADVLLVAEIVSPGSWRADRRRKPDIYAAGGIPTFWRVDLSPLTIVEHHLDGTGYQIAQVVTSGDLIVDRPFPMRLRLDALRTLGT